MEPDSVGLFFVHIDTAIYNFDERDNELFEIRLDRLVDKWSGSIEVGETFKQSFDNKLPAKTATQYPKSQVGLTTHNPGQLDFPATMTNLRLGTTMMRWTLFAEQEYLHLLLSVKIFVLSVITMFHLQWLRHSHKWKRNQVIKILWR